MAVLFILPMAGALILYLIMRSLVRRPGRNLQARFVAFGPLAGRTREEIIAAVGAPNSRSALAGGKTVCQWIASGYHIVLRFDGEICDGVTHETSV